MTAFRYIKALSALTATAANRDTTATLIATKDIAAIKAIKDKTILQE